MSPFEKAKEDFSNKLDDNALAMDKEGWWLCYYDFPKNQIEHTSPAMRKWVHVIVMPKSMKQCQI